MRLLSTLKSGGTPRCCAYESLFDRMRLREANTILRAVDIKSPPINSERTCIVYTRADRKGAHRAAYEKNRKKILKTQDTCAICGKPVDKKIKTPHPLSPAIDHIIPIAKGGHPSDIDNLQLTHMTCNRAKSDKLFNSDKVIEEGKGTIGNRNLPLSVEWSKYKP